MLKTYKKKFILINIVASILYLILSNAISAELPRPLNESDEKLYKKIFDLQELGDFNSSNKLIKLIKNNILMGRVYAQRYLHPKSYISKFSELKTWLNKYSDHPSASRIFWLAKRKKSKSEKSVKKPDGGYLSGFGSTNEKTLRPKIPSSYKGRSSPSATRANAYKIRKYIRSSWPSGALEFLNKPSVIKYFTDKEESQLHWEIANGYFIFNKDYEAIRESSKALIISKGNNEMAWFTAGISSWRRGNKNKSLLFFKNLANMKVASGEFRSAGAYWASRIEMLNKNPEEAINLLIIASKEKETFYGQLAISALGLEAVFKFDTPDLSEEFLNWILSKEGGKRAFSLIQVGEYWHADREFRKIYPITPEKFHLQMMSIASKYGMPSLALRLADLERKKTGKIWYGALYPSFIFQKNDEVFKDLPLVLSIVRQESRFDQRGKSPKKAQGLMQILPSTAAFIMKDKNYKGNLRHDLLIPNISFHIGEKYINHLLKEPIINNDLVKLLAAYNGGPGNLKKWLKNINYQNDPILLIETIPSRETRSYLKAVLKNLFVYRIKYKQKNLAHSKLASGR